jgi:K+-sensing histidine kinase KdpD
MKRDRTRQLKYLAGLWFGGSFAFALATLVCFRLGFDSTTTAFIYLLVIVALSLLDSFLSSAFFSIVAIGCLNYFFVEPIFSFYVLRSQDIVMLFAFLGTSLAITGLVRRMARPGDSKRAEEEVRRNEQRYHYLFQYSPVALLQIDTRALIALFENALSRGITDYEAFLDENPGLACRQPVGQRSRRHECDPDPPEGRELSYQRPNNLHAGIRCRLHERRTFGSRQLCDRAL